MKRRIILLTMAMLMLLTYLPVIAQDIGAAELPEAAKEPIDAVAPAVPQTQALDAKDSESSGIVKVQGIECPLVLTDSVSQSNSGEGAAQQSEKSLREVLFEAQLGFAESVNVYDYKLTLQQLRAAVQDLVYSEPMLFHLQGTYSYSTLGEYIYAYYPKFNMTKEEYTNACTYVDQELDSILALSGANDVEDDFLQALLINDYLASHFEYDLTYTYYDMYNMLTRKTAVCQGYTLLYDALLTRCGIEVGYAQSDAMNHIWNLVKIGESYYHVDVTWNDPTSDKYSLARHEYFLLSDSYIASNGPGNAHYSWITSDNIQCDSTLYDSNILTDSRSPFVLCAEDIYYINEIDSTLCRYIDAFTEGEVILELDDVWPVADKPGYVYSGYFSGLAAYGGKLYYNGVNTVHCYDPAAKSDTVLVTLTGSDETAYDIIGLRYDGEQKLAYALAADAVDDVSEIRYYTLPEMPDYAPCDVNHDGLVNIADVNCLLSYLAGVEEDGSFDLDVNDNALINIEDLNLVLIELAYSA